MDTPPPNLPRSLLVAVKKLTEALDEAGVDYALIGGLAAGYRSRPRFTQDVDLLLQVPQLSLPALLDKLKEQGFDFDAMTVIRQWNAEHMTVLDFAGVRVDWLKPVLPCFQHVLDTAREETWLDSPVRIASAEALILLKLVSFRRQDVADIEALLAANRGELELAWIHRELATVVSADDPRMQRYREMLNEFYATQEGESNEGP
jgi:hypothetical protein